MRSTRRASIYFALLLILAITGSTFAITFFNVLVEGTLSHTQTQGESQTLEMDCDASGEVSAAYYQDLDSSGTIDAGENPLFQITFMDNTTEFPPDTDPATGSMVFPWPLNMPEGHYVIMAHDDSDTMEYDISVYAPSTVTHSVSGTVIMEGITPPDSFLMRGSFLAGTMSPPQLMFAIPDEMGDFYFNWPDGDASIMFMVPWDITGFEFEDPGFLTVDGHITDFDLNFTRLGLSDLAVLVDDVESDVFVQGQVLSIRMNCAAGESSYVMVDVIQDLNGNGSIDSGEPGFYPAPWIIYDNYDEGFPHDSDYEDGRIHARLPVFPVGDYVLRVNDGMTELTAPLTVEEPSPLTMSLSGRVSLEMSSSPDSILDGLMISVKSTSDDELIYNAICDSMGDYSCNWAEGSDNVDIFFTAPYPTDFWAFASETLNTYVDHHETGVDIMVHLSSYLDSIQVNFKVDSGGWDVSPHEIQAAYIDPVSHAILDTRVFPDSTNIYLPVRPDSFGILFQPVDTVYFLQHNFISPYDTIWMSGSSYPGEIDVYVDLTNYHFLLYLDGFELDSVPDEGIPVELFGEDSLGLYEYYTEFRIFIGYYDSVYMVASERELCDGWWTLVIPDILPGNYIPAVTETTFYIPEVGGWPWYGMHISVAFDDIAERSLPLDKGLSVYPNPFNGAVAVDFSIDQPGPTQIGVYNVMGEQIATLIDKNMEKGEHKAIWNATDREGNAIPSGVYFFRLSAPSQSIIKKGLYIR